VTEQITFVTGAASGIGKAVALQAAARGDDVAGLDIDDEGLAALGEEAADLAGNLLTVVADVSAERDVSLAFDTVTTRFGVPTRVFANAGIEINAQSHTLTSAAWDSVLAINLTGAFLTCRYALQAMVAASAAGSIVCTSSPSAFVGFAGGGNAAYGASKGGISALVRSLAIDYAHYGIRVNAVVPGATNTAMLFNSVAEKVDPQSLAKQAREQIPLRRLAEPAEIAAAVLWLLSEDASYVTGSHLICDGGLMAKSANTF
jgi:NAD(P)-dependent dehydrogenase (short-subunit alcohol dehydrogenase family)